MRSELIPAIKTFEGMAGAFFGCLSSFTIGLTIFGLFFLAGRLSPGLIRGLTERQNVSRRPARVLGRVTIAPTAGVTGREMHSVNATV